MAAQLVHVKDCQCSVHWSNKPVFAIYKMADLYHGWLLAIQSQQQFSTHLLPLLHIQAPMHHDRAQLAAG